MLALNWAYCITGNARVYLSLNRRKIKPHFAHILHLDYSDPLVLSNQLKSLKLDLVVNTIGLTDVDLCDRRPEYAQLVNCTLSETIALACRLSNIKLVHISTDQIFDGAQSLVDESVSARPLNVYGQTKLNAEIAVASALPEALILRTNFYGWGTSYRMSYSDYLLSAIQSGNLVTVPNDIYFTPMLISELARIVGELIRHGCSGIFHLGSDTRLSKYEFACLLANRSGVSTEMLHPVPSAQLSCRAIRPRDMSLSNAKASSVATEPIGTVERHIELLFKQTNLKKELRSL